MAVWILDQILIKLHGLKILHVIMELIQPAAINTTNWSVVGIQISINHLALHK